MYQYKPIPSIVQQKLPFTQINMRELGKNELSAIFIILMECLITTNNQRKIENFYIKDIQLNQNFGFRYQQFLKKTFNTKELITFKIFPEFQKVQDPTNVQSGEFLKPFYYEKTNKQISIPSVIGYIYKMFNLFIVIAASQHLGSGKTQIPKDCYAILLKELDSQYSIIKEQQPSYRVQNVKIKFQCIIYNCITKMTITLQVNLYLNLQGKLNNYVENVKINQLINNIQKQIQSHIVLQMCRNLDEIR